MYLKKYIEIAKEKNNISSNNKLAKVVGVSGPAMTLFYNKKATPSPDTILKIGKLAGIDEKEILFDLLFDRFSKYQEVKKVLTDLKNLTVENKKS